MTIEFWIAFGGPVLIGVLSYAFLELTRPRAQRTGVVVPDTLATTLADAEKSARRAADEIAKARLLMTPR